MYKLYLITPKWITWFINLLPGSKHLYSFFIRRYKIKKEKIRLKDALNGIETDTNKIVEDWHKFKVIKDTMLFETHYGQKFSDSPMEMCREAIANPKYKKYKITIVLKNKEILKSVRKDIRESKRVSFVYKENKFEYFKKLHTSEYIYSNGSMSSLWIKKDGQNFINTWHGDSVKTLGKDINADLSNGLRAQTTFLLADKIVVQSQELKDIILNAYMIPSDMAYKIIIEKPWKWNSRFKEKMNKTILYAPTWRANNHRIDIKKSKKAIMKQVDIMKGLIPADTKVLFSLHPLVHVNFIPKGFEDIQNNYVIDELMGSVDLVITDYSGLMFDAVNSDSKLMILSPDLDKYEKERGLYKRFYPLTDGIRVQTRDEFKDFMDKFNNGQLKECDRKDVYTSERTPIDFIPKLRLIENNLIYGLDFISKPVKCSVNEKRISKLNKKTDVVLVNSKSANTIRVKELSKEGQKFLVISNRKLWTLKEETSILNSKRSCVWTDQSLSNLDSSTQLMSKGNFSNFKFKKLIDYSGTFTEFGQMFKYLSDDKSYSVIKTGNEELDKQFNKKMVKDNYKLID